ncbi:PREDICTED: transcription factor bHLH114, partial [Camelina sativa]|uniref:Transcription factor bHLH114 n=1 Tax=Camelina sativa TaxID=90675 RepID=A0ABM0SP56_CAMSA
SIERHKSGLSLSTKERKDKLGERITALQQLVSPYGKTDTASVLLEGMQYIQFLQEQVKVLSAPYLQATTPTNTQERKDKLGERITALQQLVSPYGKTDTASVLLEGMQYIQFLQEQVKVLSAPYLQATTPTNTQE